MKLFLDESGTKWQNIPPISDHSLERIGSRDGHAYAAMSDSCRMMRICAYAYACRQKKSDVAKREK